MKEVSFSSRAVHALGRFLSDVGLCGLAATIFQYQWRHGIRSSPLAIAIADARLLAGENAKAIVFFREVCRREAGHTEARAGLVCALFRQGTLRDAAAEAGALAAAAPSAEAWVLVAELRKRAGDTVGSLAAFRRAAKVGLAPARFVVGEALFGEEAWSDLVAPLVNVYGG